MVRYFIMLALISAIIYIYRYIADKEDRTITNITLKRVSISVIYGVIVTSVLFLLNNLQGL